MDDLQPVAVNLLLDNWSDAEVLAHLRDEGCTPLVAKNILSKAQESLRSRNRVKGAVISAGGLLLVLVAQFAQDSNHQFYGRTAAKAGMLALVGTPVGIGIILVGLYYIFFGRSVRSFEE
jgi:hypothetical protein